MPKIDRYIIFDEINKMYWRSDTGHGNYGGINEAWHFGKEDIHNQTTMLERHARRHEVILRINKDGSTTKIR